MRAVLEVIKKISRQIAERESKLFLLRNLMGAIVPELDGMPKSSGVSCKVERLAVSIADLESEIFELKGIKIICQLELYGLLAKKIFDGDVCNVIFQRYGLLKKFGEIAAELHYSESVIFRLHRIGLKFLGVKGSLSDDYEFEN